MKQKIVLATTNKGKLAQFKELFAPLSEKYEVVSLADIGYTKEIVEDADTFEGNSLKKAQQVFNDTGLIAIADDSGLCVDALNGAPGVFSHRWTGELTEPAQQVEFLLNKLKDVPESARGAHYTCVITCTWGNSSSQQIVTEGYLYGKIARTPVYGNGIVYDAAFIAEGYDKLLSLLPPDEIAKINHRGIAARKLLEEFMQVQPIKK